MSELQRITLLRRAEYLKRLARGVQTSAVKLIEEVEAMERELKTAGRRNSESKTASVRS